MAGADEAEQTRQASPPTVTPRAETQAGEHAQQTTEQAQQGAPEQGAHGAAEQDGANGEVRADAQAQQPPGFGERGRMRRRARFLRRARELAYRDLGGLVFDLHRFGQRNDQLVLAKLAMLRQIDTEVRELEAALGDRRAVTVLREAGIAACPRCAAIHDSDDRFCPRCGLAFDANADLPISTAPIQSQAQPQTPLTQSPINPTSSGPAAAATPTPPVKPTTAPVPAKPVSSPAPTQPKEPESAPEDEPTQILRPQTPDK